MTTLSIEKQKLYPLFLLLALGICWGTSFSIARLTVLSGVHPIGYAFWQNVGPAILLSLFTFFKEKKFIRLQKSSLIFYFFAGFIGIFLPNLIQYFSATRLPSGLLGLVVNTAPLFTYILSLMFFIESFSWLRMLSVVSAVIGLFLIFVPQEGTAFSGLWLAFAFLIPFFLSSTTIYTVKFRPEKQSSLQLATGMLVASCFLTVPLTFSTHHFVDITNVNFLPNFLIMGEILLSSLGYVLFFELLKAAGPVYYSLVSCVVALSAILWGQILFGERIGFMGVVIVLFAIFGIQFRVKRGTEHS